MVRGNTLTLSPALELTPISLSSKFDVAFSPVAFLIFYTGGKIGTGWNLPFLGAKGLAIFDESTQDYESVAPFASYFYQWYTEGLFQFDLAALLPGDWNPSFMKVGISPVINFTFNEKHSLLVQFRFSSRRAYTTEIQPDTHEFYYTYTGKEWFFDRIGLSYAIKL